MKKIYALLLTAAGIVLSASAQPFEKGDKLLGGSIGYVVQRSTNIVPPPSTNQNRDYRYYAFNIAPSLNFFTKPNRVIGFSLLFGYGSSIPSNDNYVQKTYTYGASFFKQYWNALGKNFYFNIQGRAGANYGKNTYTYTTQKEEIRSATAAIAIEPGFAYRMKKRLVLDVYYTSFLSAAYTFNERRSSSTAYTRDYIISASTGLQNFSLNNVVFGFRYLL